MTTALTNQRIWITGATSGIGKALALELAKHNKVIISGRNQEILDEMKAQYPNNMSTVAFDINNKEAISDIQNQLIESIDYLDCAMLNAGTCEYLDVQNFDVNLIERVMNTNFMGFVHTVAIALPLLRRAKKTNNNPYLLGMSSTVAYTGLPRAEAYGASKAAIRLFLQSLRADLTPEKIDVSIICPGFVKTPLTDQNDFAMPMRISSEEAADYIIKGMIKRKHEIHFPKRFSRLMKLYASLPSGLRNKMNQKMVKSS